MKPLEVGVRTWVYMRGICFAMGLVLLAALSLSAEEPLPDLSGRWVTVQRIVTIAQLPFIGEVTILTTIGFFSDVRQSGCQLALEDAYCFTDIDVSTDLFVTDISDVTMHLIRPAPRTAELRVGDCEVLFVHDWHTEVRGAVLDDQVYDSLPDCRSDLRVVDLDGDGKIGFTMPVELVGLFGGDTYVVQRLCYRLAGRLIDPDTIVGTVEWSSEQVILWATDALLMIAYRQSVDPDPAVHRLLMRRIDETWTCELIRDRLAPLIELLGGADLTGP